MIYSLSGKKLYIAGHTGMVGKAITRRLQSEKCQIITARHVDLDLKNQDSVNRWMKVNKPQIIILAAATVGGIYANSAYPATFLYDNLMIEANVINAAKENGIEKLLFIGSAAIYPTDAKQPIAEEDIFLGKLDSTKQWYAVAKIAGLKLVESYRLQYNCDFISCVPNNLYGPFDNYDLEKSHALAAILRKIYEAKKRKLDQVTIWGTGNQKREFLYVDDLADACVFLLKNYSGEKAVNVGTGADIMIKQLTEMMVKIINYDGKIVYDTNMPEGTKQRLLDVSFLKNLGWQAKVDIETGINLTYKDYLDRLA